MSRPQKKNRLRNKKDGSSGSSSQPTASLSRGKLWCFRLLLIFGFPIVFLAAAELILRVAGFGYPTSFFLTSESHGQKVFVQNDQFGWRFFGPAMARMPEPICIPCTKVTNTVRIIVFGESAALGDPQPRFGLAHMLQAMLELRYPNTRFEVVNAGIVAINSNVILPIARDCTRAGADIWVIYMGNNEVVGPFGAGTVFGRQVPPLPLIHADLALKSTRIGQFFDSLASKIHKPPADKSEWGGMEMFLDQRVPLDDPRMGMVYDHFSRNLSDIVRLGRQSGAGVVLSTVAVNLRDCAPFASAHRRNLSKEDESKWQTLYENGRAAETVGKMQDAAQWFQQAAQIDDQFAELRYRQASCLLALGQAADARAQFIAARDLDTLRFRCDDKLNNLIRDVATKANDTSVTLADAENAFAQNSADGLPGNELFYEHVHLTFHGNYLLALTIAPKLESLLPVGIQRAVNPNQPWPTEDDCAKRLAWSDWNKEKAFADIYSRLHGAPFSGQLNDDARLKEVHDLLEKLAPAAQSSGISQAKAICENALLAAPADPLLRQQLVELDQLTGDIKSAETNAAAVVDLLPGSSEDWSQLGVILATQKEYQQAASAFRRAVEINPLDAWALQNIAQCLKDLGQRDEAIHEYRHALAVKPRFGPAWIGLGQMLEESGNLTEATNCYRKALQNRILKGPEMASLARFCVGRGWREAAVTNYNDAIRLDPSDASLYLEAGQNLSALERHEEAAREFSEAARISPDSMQTHFLLGMELGRLGKASDAVAQFRDAVRLMPQLPEAHFNLGLSLVDTENYQEALNEFNKVLELDPKNPQAPRYVQAIRQKLARAQSH